MLPVYVALEECPLADLAYFRLHAKTCNLFAQLEGEGFIFAGMVMSIKDITPTLEFCINFDSVRETLKGYANFSHPSLFQILI